MDGRGSIAEGLRLTLDDQDTQSIEGFGKLQAFQILSPMDRGWGGEELRHCGGNELWLGLIVFPRNPQTGEQVIIGIGSKILTKCWNHQQSLVGHILYLVFL